MSQNVCSRELALRIALAARALPDTDAKRLLSVLAECTHAVMTESAVASICLDEFKQANDGFFGGYSDQCLLNALSILKNTAADKVMPAIKAYQEGELPNSVRMACASDDAIHANGQFATCPWFMVYQVNAEEARLIDIRHTEIPEGLWVQDKNSYRAELIQDCKVLYVVSVGGPAVAKIVKQGIHPIKLDEPHSLVDILSELQAVIADSPPPWLAKAMGVDASERFKFDRLATG